MSPPPPIAQQPASEVIFLQEMHLNSSRLEIFKCNRFSHQVQAYWSKTRGVAILLSAKLWPTILSQKQDPNGRYLFLNVRLNNVLYTLALMYAPNSNQLEFLQDTLHRLSLFQQGPIVLGGDLNLLVNSTLDYSGNRTTLHPSNPIRAGGRKLHNLLLKYNLKDAWWSLYPTAREYTHFSQQFNSFARLNVILVSPSLEQALKDAEVGPRLWSDHAWVEVRMHSTDLPKTKPTWRLNSKLLYLEPFHTDIQKAIVEYFELNSSCGVSQQIIWEAMKAVIRGWIISSTIAYLKQKKET